MCVMSKKDGVKSHISMLQIVFVALLTAFLGMLGYVFIHIDDNFSNLQIICGSVAVLLLCAIMAFILKRYFKLTKKLEKMK